MRSDLQCTADKLNEMATLFQTIQTLLKSSNPNSAAISNLARLGQYSCEDRAQSVEHISEDLDRVANSNFY